MWRAGTSDIGTTGTRFVVQTSPLVPSRPPAPVYWVVHVRGLPGIAFCEPCYTKMYRSSSRPLSGHSPDCRRRPAPNCAGTGSCDMASCSVPARHLFAEIASGAPGCAKPGERAVAGLWLHSTLKLHMFRHQYRSARRVAISVRCRCCCFLTTDGSMWR